MQQIEIQLVQGKETKGTYRYENNEPNAAITTLYIRKEAFSGKVPPKTIRLVVDEVE